MSNEKELVLFCREDGKWAVYDDTYDITIHCESQQEQDDAVKMLERANECRDFSATGMLDKYVPKYPRRLLLRCQDSARTGWLPGKAARDARLISRPAMMAMENAASVFLPTGTSEEAAG